MADYPEAGPTMLGKVTAAAMLTDGTTTVRLEFEFDAQGLIGSLRPLGGDLDCRGFPTPNVRLS